MANNEQSSEQKYIPIDQVEELDPVLNRYDYEGSRQDPSTDQANQRDNPVEDKLQRLSVSVKEHEMDITSLKATAKEHEERISVIEKKKRLDHQDASGPGVSHYATFLDQSPELGIQEVPSSVRLGFIKELGKDGFGTVHKVLFPKEELYAAKVLFDNSALNMSRQREILVLKSCHSPYIIQLLAVCQIPALTKTSVLIMELMEQNFEVYFVNSGNSSIKPTNHCIVGVLIQVSKGLKYLHSYKPDKIIHRDLTARNILLCNLKDQPPKAKIADFGLSRFVDSIKKVVTMTKIGATQYYLAPEVDTKRHCYNEKIDIFSFGHLMLCSLIRKIIEELPDDCQPLDANHDLDYPGNLLRLTEVKRREKFLQQMPEMGDSKARELVVNCLKLEHEKRPSAEELIVSLEDISKSISLLSRGSFKKPVSEDFSGIN